MLINYGNKNIDEVVERIVDQQFIIIGENTRCENISVDGEIQIKKKKVNYRNIYFFKNEEQYREWKVWARQELEKEGIEAELDNIDMIYGLNYRIVATNKAQLRLGF